MSNLFSFSKSANLVGGFWEGLDNVISTVWAFLGDILVSIVFWLFQFVLNIVDLIQFMLKKFIGLDYWGTDKVSIDTLGESDIVFKFLYSEEVQKAFRAMVVIFIVLLIVFSIIAIIKSEYELAASGDKKKTGSKLPILRTALKSMLTVALIPILLTLGIVSSNAILTSLVNALNVDNNLTIGSQIFSASAYSSNRYRVYADQNTRYMATNLVNVVVECEYCGQTHVYKMESGLKAIDPGNYKKGDRGTFKGYLFTFEGKKFLYELTDNVTSPVRYSPCHGDVVALDMKKAAIETYLRDYLGATSITYVPPVYLDNENDDDEKIKAAYNTWHFNDRYLRGFEFESTIDMGQARPVSTFSGHTFANVFFPNNAASWKPYFDGGYRTYIDDTYNEVVNFSYTPIVDEYYVMADVVDFLVSNEVELSYIKVGDARINWQYYGTDTNLAKYVGNRENDASKEINRLVVDYSDAGLIGYEANTEANNEADGAVFIMCFKDTVTGNYVPVLNRQEFSIAGKKYNFSSTYFAESYNGVIIARGMLDKTNDNNYGWPTILSTSYSNGNVTTSGDETEYLSTYADDAYSMFYNIKDYEIDLNPHFASIKGDGLTVNKYNAILGGNITESNKTEAQKYIVGESYEDFLSRVSGSISSGISNDYIQYFIGNDSITSGSTGWDIVKNKIIKNLPTRVSVRYYESLTSSGTSLTSTDYTSYTNEITFNIDGVNDKWEFARVSRLYNGKNYLRFNYVTNGLYKNVSGYLLRCYVDIEALLEGKMSYYLAHDFEDRQSNGSYPMITLENVESDDDYVKQLCNIIGNGKTKESVGVVIVNDKRAGKEDAGCRFPVSEKFVYFDEINACLENDMSITTNKDEESIVTTFNSTVRSATLAYEFENIISDIWIDENHDAIHNAPDDVDGRSYYSVYWAIKEGKFLSFSTPEVDDNGNITITGSAVPKTSVNENNFAYRFLFADEGLERGVQIKMFIGVSSGMVVYTVGDFYKYVLYTVNSDGEHELVDYKGIGPGYVSATPVYNKIFDSYELSFISNEERVHKDVTTGEEIKYTLSTARAIFDNSSFYGYFLDETSYGEQRFITRYEDNWDVEDKFIETMKVFVIETDGNGRVVYNPNDLIDDNILRKDIYEILKGENFTGKTPREIAEFLKRAENDGLIDISDIKYEAHESIISFDYNGTSYDVVYHKYTDSNNISHDEYYDILAIYSESETNFWSYGGDYSVNHWMGTKLETSKTLKKDSVEIAFTNESTVSEVYYYINGDGIDNLGITYVVNDTIEIPYVEDIDYVKSFYMDGKKYYVEYSIDFFNSPFMFFEGFYTVLEKSEATYQEFYNWTVRNDDYDVGNGAEYGITDYEVEYWDNDPSTDDVYISSFMKGSVKYYVKYDSSKNVVGVFKDMSSRFLDTESKNADKLAEKINALGTAVTNIGSHKINNIYVSEFTLDERWSPKTYNINYTVNNANNHSRYSVNPSDISFMWLEKLDQKDMNEYLADSSTDEYIFDLIENSVEFSNYHTKETVGNVERITQFGQYLISYNDDAEKDNPVITGFSIMNPVYAPLKIDVEDYMQVYFNMYENTAFGLEYDYNTNNPYNTNIPLLYDPEYQVFYNDGGVYWFGYSNFYKYDLATSKFVYYNTATGDIDASLGALTGVASNFEANANSGLINEFIEKYKEQVNLQYYTISENEIDVVDHKYIGSEDYRDALTVNIVERFDIYQVEMLVYSGKSGIKDDNSYLMRVYGYLRMKRDNNKLDDKVAYPSELTANHYKEILNNSYKYVYGGDELERLPSYSADVIIETYSDFSPILYMIRTRVNNTLWIWDVKLTGLFNGSLRTGWEWFINDYLEQSVELKLNSGACRLNYSLPVFSANKNLSFESVYVPHKFNFILFVFAVIIIFNVMFTAIWGLITRIYEITIYFIIMPGVAAATVIDNNKMFNNWKSNIIKKVFSAYGVILGLNLFFLLIPPIKSASQIFNEWDLEFVHMIDDIPGQLKATYINNIIYIIFLLVAISMIKTLPQLISDMMGVDNSYKVGGDTRKNVTNVINEVKNDMSGKTLIDSIHKNFGEFEYNAKTGKREFKFGDNSLINFLPASAIIENYKAKRKQKEDAENAQLEQARKDMANKQADEKKDGIDKKMEQGFRFSETDEEGVQNGIPTGVGGAGQGEGGPQGGQESGGPNAPGGTPQGPGGPNAPGGESQVYNTGDGAADESQESQVYFATFDNQMIGSMVNEYNRLQGQTDEDSMAQKQAIAEQFGALKDDGTIDEAMMNSIVGDGGLAKKALYENMFEEDNVKIAQQALDKTDAEIAQKEAEIEQLKDTVLNGTPEAAQQAALDIIKKEEEINELRGNRSDLENDLAKAQKQAEEVFTFNSKALHTGTLTKSQYDEAVERLKPHDAEIKRLEDVIKYEDLEAKDDEFNKLLKKETLNDQMLQASGSKRKPQTRLEYFNKMFTDGETSENVRNDLLKRGYKENSADAIAKQYDKYRQGLDAHNTLDTCKKLIASEKAASDKDRKDVEASRKAQTKFKPYQTTTISTGFDTEEFNMPTDYYAPYVGDVIGDRDKPITDVFDDLADEIADLEQEKIKELSRLGDERADIEKAGLDTTEIDNQINDYTAHVDAEIAAKQQARNNIAAYFGAIDENGNIDENVMNEVKTKLVAFNNAVAEKDVAEQAKIVAQEEFDKADQAAKEHSEKIAQKQAEVDAITDPDEKLKATQELSNMKEEQLTLDLARNLKKKELDKANNNLSDAAAKAGFEYIAYMTNSMSYADYQKDKQAKEALDKTIAENERNLVQGKNSYDEFVNNSKRWAAEKIGGKNKLQMFIEAYTADEDDLSKYTNDKVFNQQYKMFVNGKEAAKAYQDLQKVQAQNIKDRDALAEKLNNDLAGKQAFMDGKKPPQSTATGSQGQAGEQGHTGTQGQQGQTGAQGQTGSEANANKAIVDEAKFYADCAKQYADVSKDYANISSGKVPEYTKEELGLVKPTWADGILQFLQNRREKRAEKGKLDSVRNKNEKQEAYEQYNQTHEDNMIMDPNSPAIKSAIKDQVNSAPVKIDESTKNQLVSDLRKSFLRKDSKEQAIALDAINQYKQANNITGDLSAEEREKAFAAQAEKAILADRTIKDESDEGYHDAVIDFYNSKHADSGLSRAGTISIQDFQKAEEEYKNNVKALEAGAFSNMRDKKIIDDWNANHADRQITDSMDKQERAVLMNEATNEFNINQDSYKRLAEHQYVGKKEEEFIEGFSRFTAEEREKQNKWDSKGVIGKAGMIMAGEGRGFVGRILSLPGLAVKGVLHFVVRKPSEGEKLKHENARNEAEQKHKLLSSELSRMEQPNYNKNAVESDLTLKEKQKYISDWESKNGNSWSSLSQAEKNDNLYKAKLDELRSQVAAAKKDFDDKSMIAEFKAHGLIPRVTRLAAGYVDRKVKAFANNRIVKGLVGGATGFVKNSAEGINNKLMSWIGKGAVNKRDNTKVTELEQNMNNAKAERDQAEKDYNTNKSKENKKAYEKANKKYFDAEQKYLKELNKKDTNALKAYKFNTQGTPSEAMQKAAMSTAQGLATRKQFIRVRKQEYNANSNSIKSKVVRGASSAAKTIKHIFTGNPSKAIAKGMVKANAGQTKQDVQNAINRGYAKRANEKATLEEADIRKLASRYKADFASIVTSKDFDVNSISDEKLRSELSKLISAHNDPNLKFNLEKISNKKAMELMNSIAKDIEKRGSALAAKVSMKASTLAQDRALKNLSKQFNKIQGSNIKLDKDALKKIVGGRATVAANRSTYREDTLSTTERREVEKIARQYAGDIRSKVQSIMKSDPELFKNVKLSDFKIPSDALRNSKTLTRMIENEVKTMKSAKMSKENLSKIKKLEKALQDIKNVNKSMRFKIKGINSKASPTKALNQVSGTDDGGTTGGSSPGDNRPHFTDKSEENFRK